MITTLITEMSAIFQFTLEQCLDFVQFSANKAVYLFNFFAGLFHERAHLIDLKSPSHEVADEEEEEDDEPPFSRKNHWIF